MSETEPSQALAVAQIGAETFDLGYTEIVRAWLNCRFARQGDHYVAHEPIDGLAHEGSSEGGCLRRARRLMDLALLARSVGARSILDVGGAEGYFAALCRDVLGLEATSFDLSHEASLRAREFWGLASVAGNAAFLPFADDSFDIVSIAEVLEHLGDPITALLEARRVARVAVLISTEEFHDDEVLRSSVLSERSLEAHCERNVFTSGDFRALFPGRELRLTQQVFPDDELEQGGIDRATFAAFMKDEIEGVQAGCYVLALEGEAPAMGELSGNDEAREKLIEALWSGLPRLKQVDPLDLSKLACPLCKQPIVAAENGVEVQCRSCGVSARTPAGDTPDLFVQEPARLAIPAALARLAPGQARPDLAILLDLDRRFALRPRSLHFGCGGVEMTDPASGWRFFNFEVTGDGRGRTLGDDPQWVSPFLGLATTEFDELYIHYKVAPRMVENAVEIYWQNEGDFDFCQAKSLTRPFRSVDLAGGGLMLPLGSLMKTSRYLVRLRIDPVNLGSGIEIEIGSAALLKRVGESSAAG